MLQWPDWLVFAANVWHTIKWPLAILVAIIAGALLSRFL